MNKPTTTRGPVFLSELPTDDCAGMTLRQYAAIKLKVPDSGTDWIDVMIRESLRNDFAAKALQSELPEGIPANFASQGNAAHYAYQMADAMLAAREKGKPQT